MYGKAVLNEMAPYQQGKQMKDVKAEYGLDTIVKLASNENPYGFSPKITEALPVMMQELELYPDGHASKLRHKLANQLDVKEDQLVFGSGSDELVQIICRTFLYSGVNTVMATPTFPQYKHHARVEGADVIEIPVKNGYHDVEKMLDAINDQTRVVWLCTPNNPTGSQMSKADFKQFMDHIPDDILVVLDEAYVEFIQPKQRYDTIGALKHYPNLLLLRTFSKAYGLAGLRVGYGIGSEELIGKLNIVRGPFNTSSLAQEAACIALDDATFIQETNQRNREVKERFEKGLEKLGWAHDDSETNFVLVHSPVSGDALADYLLQNGFIVRAGEGIGAPNTVRITVGRQKDMDKLLMLLNEFSY